jgi:ubiquinone/menaquinone biosynthesis C-methylase UbiE
MLVGGRSSLVVQGGLVNKKLVQEQFGANAAAYATSVVHAHGSSLSRLVELIQPRPEWRVLDVATAAGHTAHALAPHVAAVVATDITAAMLPLAARLAQAKGIANLVTAVVDAEALAFTGGSFDLVTCRIAPHHFPEIACFVRESVRLLRPGGILAVVDNVVPGGEGIRRKKDREQAINAGRYVNAFEKLRDPSHGRCLSAGEWRQLFSQAGLTLLHEEVEWKSLDFDDWVARMQVTAVDVVRLRVMIRQAPPAVLDYLRPQFTGERITFHLAEAIVIGRKA